MFKEDDSLVDFEELLDDLVEAILNGDAEVVKVEIKKDDGPDRGPDEGPDDEPKCEEDGAKEEFRKQFEHEKQAAVKAFKEAKDEGGDEFANDLIEMSALEALFTYAMDNHLPFRPEDVAMYNTLVKKFFPWNQYKDVVDGKYKKMEEVIAEGKKDLGVE